MNRNINYYALLNVLNTATEKEIKKSYYKLSFLHHPDTGGDASVFTELAEAYRILTEEKEEYDKHSRYGANYDESIELIHYEFTNEKAGWDEDKIKTVRENQLNIVIEVGNDFDGTIEYARYVKCKKCDGTGMDWESKIILYNKDGSVKAILDGVDGCDFCEGKGKDFRGNICKYCIGAGKVGSQHCGTCKGERRIMGKQKLTGIKFTDGEKAHKIDSMGNCSKTEAGKIGQLWLVRKTT